MATIIIVYLVLINIAAFALYGADKLKAKQGAWRISEKTLLLIAALGGSYGAFLGMQVFHHKTQHPQFKYGVPAMMLVHTALLVWLFPGIKG